MKQQAATETKQPQQAAHEMQWQAANELKQQEQAAADCAYGTKQPATYETEIDTAGSLRVETASPALDETAGSL